MCLQEDGVASPPEGKRLRGACRVLENACNLRSAGGGRAKAHVGRRRGALIVGDLANA